MYPELNMTYLILGGHVEVHRYRYLYFLILFTAYILLICFNVSIIGLIVIHKNLHEPMYIFIAALLLNSLLFSTNIYPKLLADFLSEKQIIFYQVCLFQIFLFYSLSCSEFLLLAAMAYDRYVSICKPLQYPTLTRQRTVILLLVSAWFLPACHVAVPVILNIDNKLCNFTLKGIFCNNSVIQLYCVMSRALSIYGAFVLLNVGFFPMLFIIFTYTKIILTVYRCSGEVKKKAAQTCLPHLLVLTNYSCLLTYDMIIARLESDFSKTARFVMTVQIIIYNPLCNPIIYGLKINEISKHLQQLFCRRKFN